jgi:hypothetical protein
LAALAPCSDPLWVPACALNASLAGRFASMSRLLPAIDASPHQQSGPANHQHTATIPSMNAIALRKGFPCPRPAAADVLCACPVSAASRNWFLRLPGLEIQAARAARDPRISSSQACSHFSAADTLRSTQCGTDGVPPAFPGVATPETCSRRYSNCQSASIWIGPPTTDQEPQLWSGLCLPW